MLNAATSGRRLSRAATCLLSGAALAALLAACGGSSSTSSAQDASAATPSSSVSPEIQAIRDQVPAAIRDGGTLTVPTDADYPPFQFTDEDGKTVIGVGPDIMAQLMGILGLQYDVQIISFDSILPGFSANRYVTSIGAIGVTAERAKVVDFVTFMQEGYIYVVPAGSGTQIPGSYDSVCGKTIAVLAGSLQATSAADAAENCGSDAADIQVFPTQSAVNLAVSSKRADAGLVTASTGGSLVKTHPDQFALASDSFDFIAQVGFPVSKSSGLATPLHEAMQYLMKDGAYQTTMSKWGLDPNTIPESALVTE